MALSGSVTTGEMEGRSMSLQWTATQSIKDNTSTITWKVVATGSSASGVMVREITAQINGVTVYHTDNLGQKLSVGTVVASGTKTISHNADGTASFSAYIGAGIYYQWAINTSNTANFTLNTIARASSVSTSEFYLGDTAIIKITAAAASFNHTLTYTWGKLTGTIATGKTGSTNLTVSWDTSDLLESMASQIPAAASGYGSITCSTYNGSTLIGSKTANFTAKLKDSYIPTMETLTAELDNSSNSVISEWGVAVAGFTKAHLKGSARGSLSSVVSRFEISGGYSISVNGSELDYTGDALSGGALEFAVLAVDSRGRKSTSKTASINVYDYTMPTISGFTAQRSMTDTSKVVINATWNISAIGDRNSSTASIKYRIRDSNVWTTADKAVASGTATTLSENFDVSKSYEFMLVVTDAVGKESAASTRVSTQDVFLDWRAGGIGLGIGKMAEEDHIVDINPNWKFKVHGEEILSLIEAAIPTIPDITIDGTTLVITT